MPHTQRKACWKEKQGVEEKGNVNQSTAELDPVIVNSWSKENTTDDALSEHICILGTKRETRFEGIAKTGLRNNQTTRIGTTKRLLAV